MWVDQGMILSLLMTTSSLYGFGSEDLEPFQEDLIPRAVRDQRAARISVEDALMYAGVLYAIADILNMHVNIKSSHGYPIQPSK